MTRLLGRLRRRRGDAPDETPTPGPGADTRADAGVATVVPAGLDPEDLDERPTTRRRSALRKRLRYLRQARELLLRDLGGLVYEARRSGAAHADALVEAKIDRLRVLDAELGELRAVLGDGGRALVVREPGVGGACPTCGELFGSDARFCSNCGAAVARGRRHAGATDEAAVATAGATDDASTAGVAAASVGATAPGAEVQAFDESAAERSRSLYAPQPTVAAAPADAVAGPDPARAAPAVRIDEGVAMHDEAPFASGERTSDDDLQPTTVLDVGAVTTSDGSHPAGGDPSAPAAAAALPASDAYPRSEPPHDAATGDGHDEPPQAADEMGRARPEDGDDVRYAAAEADSSREPDAAAEPYTAADTPTPDDGASRDASYQPAEAFARDDVAARDAHGVAGSSPSESQRAADVQPAVESYRPEPAADTTPETESHRSEPAAGTPSEIEPYRREPAGDMPTGTEPYRPDPAAGVGSMPATRTVDPAPVAPDDRPADDEPPTREITTVEDRR